jgi:16S rRNA (adenine(1408)-N(1))-methyltransferase
MAESSRRAAKPARKGGLPNTLFVVAAAERLPPELSRAAEELTIQFPWGSLLRGTLALDADAARGIAQLIKPDGRAIATFSIEDRDRLELPALDGGELARRWCGFGLEVCSLRPATSEELRAISSTWARRLAAGHDRVAWCLELKRVK